MQKKNTPASVIAFGGVMAALAVVIQWLGGIVTIATYVCPVVCILIMKLVLKVCGERIAWAWYGAVSILGLLLSPNLEAAAVFLFLGYYPIVKPKLEKSKFKWVLKILLFNGSILLMYWILGSVLGMEEVMEDVQTGGVMMFLVLMVLGNVTFFLVDLILTRGLRRRHG